jgi:hypothetical protein
MKKAFFTACFLAVTLAAIFAQELPRLAVVEFSTNVNNDKVKADAITVRELVESEMVKTRKYRIITREDIDKLLANQRIQVSSISSAENLKKLELQNISYIITGSLSSVGNDYVIAIRALDVSTGQFSHSDNDFMGSGSRDLFNGINGLMTKFVSGMSTGEGGVIVQGTGAGKTYNIGDFGPAGGIVFYDKGVFSNGWRYLEAAPAETEFTAEWGARQRDVPGTSTGAGSGKRNTEIIIERLNSFGESGRAAQLCANLNFDGYKDWFLPSKDELDLMYKNLKQKGLGSFRNDWYWSSSLSNDDNAWGQTFSSGGQSYGSKKGTSSVRAVRAF